MQKKKTLIYLREYLITTNPIRSLKLFFFRRLYPHRAASG